MNPEQENSSVHHLRLANSEELLNWIHSRLNGKTIPELPRNKRVQLASACWHVAIEHYMAIVVLVREGLYGSALALMRPAIEAFVRGL